MAFRINEAIKGFGYLHYDEGTQTLEFRRKHDGMERELDQMMLRILERRRNGETWKEFWKKKEAEINSLDEKERRQLEEMKRQEERNFEEEKRKAEVILENARQAEAN